MAKKGEYGGHDNDFVDEVSDRLICQICTKVLRDPHLAVCCGQHFCESCLNKWFDKQRGKPQSCPHCRTEGDAFSHVVHKGLRSEVNQLKVRCNHRGEGCNWTGELGTLKTHLESDGGCGFVAVECPNKCDGYLLRIYTMKRKELDKHLTHVCYLRPYQCEFCGHKDTYEAITGDSSYRYSRSRQVNDYYGHQAECPEVPLTCPNRCGSERIKRKDMDSHRSKCPREPVQCPFVDAGCFCKMRRYELEYHMSVNSVMQQHLMMVMEDYKVTKSRLDKAEAKIYETEASLIKTKDKLCETEARLSETEANLQLELKKVNVKLSISEDRFAWLMKTGDLVRLQMPYYSEYCRSGEIWHSPPFYYREGYKMRLDVYANGVGNGVGTHVSVSLLLLRGERDNQVRWPLKCCDTHSRMHSKLKSRDGESFFIGGAHERPAVYEYKQLHHCDRFCLKRTLKVVDDCLIFDVKFCGCFIDVCIP